jgi:hypothetical protein
VKKRRGSNAPPSHVAILGLGPSVTQYLEIVKRLGGRRKFCDETWSINALGDVFASDCVFHMDDVRVQEIRAAADPQGNIAPLLQWIKTSKVPVITSRKHHDYPALVEFPLAEVISRFGQAYFNSTAAYAVAYALFRGVKRISCFGMDFTYPNAHHAEKGRACVEFWLGMAIARGVDVRIPKGSSLMDGCHTQAEKLYGYDTREVIIKPGNPTRIRFREKAPPTAEQVEANYDHRKHPNPLVN